MFGIVKKVTRSSYIKKSKKVQKTREEDRGVVKHIHRFCVKL